MSKKQRKKQKRLTKEQVEKLLAFYKKAGVTQRQAATKFGVSQSVVSYYFNQ